MVNGSETNGVIIVPNAHENSSGSGNGPRTAAEFIAKFLAMPKDTRREKMGQLEEKKREHATAIMPWKDVAPRNFEYAYAIGDRIREHLYLEAYYAYLHTCLLAANYMDTNRQYSALPEYANSLDTLRAKAQKELEILEAIRQRGDWRQAKQKWLDLITEPQFPSIVGHDKAAREAHAEAVKRYKEELADFKVFEKVNDFQYTRELLSQTPDITAPTIYKQPPIFD